MRERKTTDALKFHPAAKHFPLMVEYRAGRILNVEQNEKWQRFVADIRINGLREAILLFDGKILDGRNRYLACRELKIPVKYVEYDGMDEDVDALSLSLNLHRRHLTAGQVASVVAEQILPAEQKAAEKRQKIDAAKGAPLAHGCAKGKATEAAARRGGIGARTLEQYVALSDENKALVKAGKKSVGGANSGERRVERDESEKKDKVAKATRLGLALASTLSAAARAAGDVSRAGKAIDYLPDHISQEIVEAYAKLRGEIVNLPFKEKE